MRAGIFTRSAAFIVDDVISSICGFFLTMPFIILRVILRRATAERSLYPYSCRRSPVHDPNLSIIFIYFVIFEGYFGYTPGKWIFDLKVLKADGRKDQLQDALIRNIPKLFILAIMVDALILMIFSGKDRQRLFDKIAGTIVIERN